MIIQFQELWGLVFFPGFLPGKGFLIARDMGPISGGHMGEFPRAGELDSTRKWQHFAHWQISPTGNKASRGFTFKETYF